MRLIKRLPRRLVRWYRLRSLRARGLDIPDDCRIISWPDWGSEPYLISIGQGVTISSGVVFVTHDGGTWVFRNDDGYQDVIRYGRIVVGDDCFIGSGAMLLPGVEIGPGSIVAARSVVTRSVAAGMVVGGVPARPISTVQDYAERCRRETPVYDVAAYRRDKRAVLEALIPRPDEPTAPTGSHGPPSVTR